MTDAQKLTMKLMKNPEFKKAWEESESEHRAMIMLCDEKSLNDIIFETGLNKEFILNLALENKLKLPD